MSVLRRIVDWLPRDMALPDDEFKARHRAMVVLLMLHLPILIAFGLSQRADLVPLLVELVPMALLLGLAMPTRLPRTVRAFAAATGLLYASLVVLHLSGGASEAAVHFLIVLAFAFLYRVWSLFLWAIVLMASSYPLLAAASPVLDATGVPYQRPEMALGALVAAGSLASIGLILAWKSAADHLQSAVHALETAKERDEMAARRDAYGKMYVNLARRSQSLVDRQLAVIDELEDDVNDPDILAGVFELDHLTTRIRRHGESLLVVADVDLPARSTQPVPLSDVVRGAQSEIEQYRRVDARIDPTIAIHGPATRDLVHLLAELLDNATTYSPPSATVKVHARAGDGGSVVVTVEDRGLGLTPDRLAQANRDLQDTDELDENSIRHLGFRVVARLAAKHGITVRLTSTNGGGVTAWVDVPASIVASGDTSNLAPARVPDAPLAAPAAATGARESEETDAGSVPQLPTRAPTSSPAPEPAAAPASAPAAPPTPPVAPAQPAAAAADAPPAASQPQHPRAPATPTASPASPMSAGFSASGRHRRGRRGRTPVSTSHDRSAATPRTQGLQPPASSPTTADDTAPRVRPPVVDNPLPTGAIRLPKPQDPAAAAPGPTRSGQPGADTPPLPRRERGATAKDAAEQQAEDEAMDLFGGMEGEDRSTLGDFQRGQESARKEARG